MADRELFESEALPWIDAVYRAALAMCGDPAAADDLLQATYLKAWTRFEQFQPGSNCRAWLMQIARNTWFDQLRRRQPVGLERAEALDQFPADPVAPPPASGDLAGYLEQMDDERLVAALLRLPEPFRVALFLVDVEEHSQKEAAEMLGVAVGTVKSRTSRARRMLREALAEEASERSATGEDSHG